MFLTIIWKVVCSPSVTRGVIVIFSTLKLESRTSVLFDALLLSIFESGVLLLTNTLLTIVVLSVFTLVVIFKVAVSPLARLPIFQRPVFKLYLPLESSLKYVRVEGRISIA